MRERHVGARDDEVWVLQGRRAASFASHGAVFGFELVAASERAVRLHDDASFGASADECFLSKVRAALDLVDGRFDATRAERAERAVRLGAAVHQGVELRGAEVADADVAREARVDEGFHRGPLFGDGRDVRRGPLQEHEVYVTAAAKRRDGVADGGLERLGREVARHEFCGDEELVARGERAVLERGGDRRANLALVAVHGRAVDVPISETERGGHRSGRLLRGHLPRAQPDHGHARAASERHHRGFGPVGRWHRGRASRRLGRARQSDESTTRRLGRCERRFAFLS